MWHFKPFDLRAIASGHPRLFGLACRIPPLSQLYSPEVFPLPRSDSFPKSPLKLAAAGTPVSRDWQQSALRPMAEYFPVFPFRILTTYLRRNYAVKYLRLSNEKLLIPLRTVPVRALALRADSRLVSLFPWQPLMTASTAATFQHDHSDFGRLPLLCHLRIPPTR